MTAFTDNFSVGYLIGPAVCSQDFKLMRNHNEPSFESPNRLEQIFLFNIFVHDTSHINGKIFSRFASLENGRSKKPSKLISQIAKLSFIKYTRNQP